ncbi:c-type cytochrome [Endozoicomonas arenosclerae]|uniref:c-type cytochrome n=1 Tax=Endozoicomonas arenosclerae TaxID=1633495 RepID=UPI000781C318|nr:cytochrome c [Endozoicomonas arenosclerae]
MLKSVALPAAATLGLLLSAMPAQAEKMPKPNLFNGEQLSKQVCLGCHGETVLPYIQQYPNLKGQKPAYIVKQLKAFKSGERENVYMQVTAKNLSQQDIVDVSHYYGTLQPDDLKNKADKTLLDNTN